VCDREDFRRVHLYFPGNWFRQHARRCRDHRARADVEWPRLRELSDEEQRRASTRCSAIKTSRITRTKRRASFAGVDIDHIDLGDDDTALPQPAVSKSSLRIHTPTSIWSRYTMI
jgi:hypothetical protein